MVESFFIGGVLVDHIGIGGRRHGLTGTLLTGVELLWLIRQETALGVDLGSLG